MSNKQMVSVRMDTDTKKRVERYAEEHEVSRSTAIRRLLEKGADLEEAGLTVAASQQSADKDEEEKMMTDGSGKVIRPMFNFIAALYATTSLSIFAVLIGSYYAGFMLALPVNPMSLISFMTTGLLVVALLVLFLYTDYPELIDRYFYSGMDRASEIKAEVV